MQKNTIKITDTLQIRRRIHGQDPDQSLEIIHARKRVQNHPKKTGNHARDHAQNLVQNLDQGLLHEKLQFQVFMRRLPGKITCLAIKIKIDVGIGQIRTLIRMVVNVGGMMVEVRIDFQEITEAVEIQVAGSVECEYLNEFSNSLK